MKCSQGHGAGLAVTIVTILVGIIRFHIFQERSRNCSRKRGELRHATSSEHATEDAFRLRLHSWNFLNLPNDTMLGDSQTVATTGRCLKLIHIPKNAGSAIEGLGARLKYAWGLHDHSLHCLNASQCTQTVPVRRLCCWPNNVTACSVWHYPPSMDEELARDYANCSTFCVVRDPLRRFVSEYFYISRHRRTPGPLCNQRMFEEYANATLQRLMEDPWIDDCHHVPQAYYLTSFTGRRLCDHIVRYKNLQEELSKVLKFYRDVDVRETKLPAGVNSVPGRCKLENLSVSEELQQRLRDFFHLDYELGLGS